MNTNDFENEYFTLTPVRALDRAGYVTPSPSIIMDSGCPPYDDEYKFIENPEMMLFCFGKGTSKSPRMIDYHYPGLVSEKLYSVLNAMNINGLQLLPATISGKGKEYKYWYLNIYNVYPVLDLEKSEYKWNDTLKAAYMIRKIVFNKLELEKIPLTERLVFRLAEDKSTYFFHKQIVDELMKIEPKSFTFKEVSEYGKLVF